MPDVGAVYLYRFAEGETPVRNFLDSYRNHPAGIEHDLHVIFKGFPNQKSLALGQALFEGLPINPIVLDDTGYDIGSYIAAAKVVSNRRLIFLNTFSRILAADWLSKFDRALSLPGVGIVGATGSWQTGASGIEAVFIKEFNNIVRYLRNFIRKPFSYGGDDVDEGRKNILAHYLLFLFKFFHVFRYLYYLTEFGRYPNPHIRTNAFMIERDRLLSLRVLSFASKTEAYKFESGRKSMTKQILAQGLRALVIDRTGNAYDVPEWRTSLTFWTDEQTQLIVADNRTGDYAMANQEFRRVLENLAWVDPWSWYL